MEFSAEQQSAILARSNTVVSAGAGSGKTSVLAMRYVDLVKSDNLRVDEILALTFTRKAAAEMYERIYRALDAESDDSFVAGQIADFDTATISTLDSFCATIARNGCTAFGVSPTFSVDEVAVARLCRETALAFLREHSHDPVVLHLAELNGFSSLWKDAFSRLAADHFTIATDFDVKGMRSYQRSCLVAAAARLISDIVENLSGIGALDPSAAACVRSGQELLAALELGEGRLRAAAESLANATEDHSPQLAEEIDRLLDQLARFGSLSLRCGSSRADVVAIYKEHVRNLRELGPQLDEVLFTMRSWPLVCQTLELASEFRDVVLRRKRESGLLSYQDVLDLAIGTLSRNVDLRRYYKTKFKAIMIDEFQDNNERQKQLLYLLAESPDTERDGVPMASDLHPGKLFFVGDEKQSIYRFRGADVSVFKRLAGELVESGDELTLRNNYRSEPGLIAFFNRLFLDVFRDAHEDYEAVFKPLESRPPTANVVATAELWSVAPRDRKDTDVPPNEDTLPNEDAEAYYIAAYIREIVSGSRTKRLAPDGRAPAYRDVAILMRSSSHQIRLERMLRLHGIPYVADAARSLFLDAPVNDMYLALQLVICPQDRVAYAGLLRSPIIGLSDNGVIRVIVQDAKPFEPCDGLREADRVRYERGVQRYRELAELADTAPVEDLLFHIWYRWGYRYHLLRRKEHAPYLEFYDYFVELARRYANDGLARFLDEVRGYLGKNLRLDDLSIMRDEQDAVQLMTIHKAKGLEFPIVIVPFASSRGQTDAITSSPFYWSRDHGLVFSLGKVTETEIRRKPINHLYRAEREARLLRDSAELKRLLYVAATRAESHLVISGINEPRDNTFMALASRAFLEIADSRDSLDSPDSPIDVSVLELPPVAQSQVDDSAARSETEAHRNISAVAEQYSAMPVIQRKAPRTEFSVTELNDAFLLRQGGDGIVSETRGALPIDAVLQREHLETQFGSLCHYLVERYGNQLGDIPSHSKGLTLPATLRPPLDPAELKLYVDTALSLVERYCSTDLARRIGSAVAVEHELPFLTQIAAGDRSIWVRGQIDLLARFTDSVLVVDFKTDRILTPHHYEPQLALYRSAAASMAGVPAESVLFSLRSGEAYTVSASVSVAQIVAAAALV